MESVEVSGKTVDEAIDVALAELGASRAEVRVEVMSAGRGGVLGIGGEPARVRVRLLEEGEAAEGAEAADADPDAASAAAPEEDEAEFAAQILDKLLQLMGVHAEVSIRDPETPGDGMGMANAVFDIEGDDLGVLIGRRGETLAALQFILNLMSSRTKGERIMFTVDAEGYRRRRERQIHSLAMRLADQAKRTRRPVAMEPMPPNERRIVHLALAEDSRVTTASIGEGENRKVEISPNR